ncbi:MAG: hypothetical protein IJ250_02835 [Bacteroidales bacterium]|nr:hypothetical protein [Bacteroidales bacterium]
MKKEKRIPLIIMMVIAVLASLSTIVYAMTFNVKLSLDQQSTAATFWNIAYWTAVVLTVCAAIGIVVFLVKQIIEEKQKGIIIIFAITVIALIVSYLCASGTDIPQMVFEKTGADYGSSKLISAALYTVYVLFAGVLLSIVYAEVSKRLK